MERKPDFHLEDVAIHEGGEKSHGWDLDREFGEGTEEHLLEILRKYPDTHEPNRVNLDILLGRFSGDAEERERFLVSAQESVEARLKDSNFEVAAWRGAHVRVFSGDLHSELPQQPFQEYNLEQLIQEQLVRKEFKDAARNEANFRLLTGRVIGSPEQQEKMMDALVERVKFRLVGGSEDNLIMAANNAAYLRILRAHEIKFIPGKGIEIIDEPPAEFQKTAEPLPESRNF